MPPDTLNDFPEDAVLPKSEITGHEAGDGDPCPLGDSPITIGKPDPLGQMVDRIFIHTNSFVIYEAGDKVQYFLNCEEERAKKLYANLYPLVDELCLIEDMVCSMRPQSLWKSSPRGDYQLFKSRVYSIIAKIMAACFHEQPETAETLAKQLLQAVKKRRDSRNRMRYIWANSFGFVFFLGVALLLHLVPFVTAFTTLGGVPIVSVITMGILGAFFSVSIGVSKVEIPQSITMYEMFYTGFIRVPIGVIAALVVVFLIEGGWILGAVEPTAKKWSLYLLGFLAGFSEMFIPNILKQVENATTVQKPVRRKPANTKPEGDPLGQSQ